MPGRADLLVKNGTIVTSTATFQADLAIADGAFVAIGVEAEGLDAAEVFDASGKYVLPGIIDEHVHFREPGLEYKEDFETGSRAAAMGGVTTVIDMPNTIPPTSTAELVRQKQESIESKAYCDVGVYGLVAQDNLDQLAPMAEAGVVGFKCFLGMTTGEIAPPDDGVLLDALRTIAGLGMRCGFHAENDAIMRHLVRQLQAEQRTDPLAHLESRPVVAEVEAIQRAALFASHMRTKIHIFHLTSREGSETIQEWRKRGVDITCEATPAHCFLTADDMQRLGSVMRINPPVREPGHADALLHGLRTGAITSIATDHSPHTLEEKRNINIWHAVSGFVGVETSLRLFLTHAVHTGQLTLQQLVRATSEGPARTWELYPRKGVIQVGADADLTIVDLDLPGTIEAAKLHSKTNVTPFDGQPTRGQAIATIVRGRVVMREAELVGPPTGRFVRRT
jgi:dihydroorotase